jgi:hypothetical protein
MRLVFAGHLPLLPGAAEGGPCAGYSGLEIELGSARSIGMGEPTYPRTHASRPPVGCLNHPVSAPSAVTLCDAIRIGFLGQSLKLASAERVFEGNAANSQEMEAQQWDFV